MPSVRELLDEGKRLRDSGDLEGAKRILSDIELEQKRESYTVPGMVGQAAVRGVTGMGDLAAGVGDLMSGKSLSKGIIRGFGGEVGPEESSQPVTDMAAKAGLTYKDPEELPEGMRPYAQGIETAAGAITPGGLVAAPAKMVANAVGKKALTSGLGFLGKEGLSALGSGQLSTVAGYADPGDKLTQAGSEIVGGMVGGIPGLLKTAYKGAKALGGKALGGITGFGSGAPGGAPAGVDELDTISNYVLDQTKGAGSQLKKLLGSIKQGPKTSPEAWSIYQSVLNSDDPARAIGPILKSAKPDTNYGLLVQGVGKKFGSKKALEEIYSATLGSLWDDALTDKGVSFAKLRQGLSGGRNSVSSIMQKHGIMNSDDANVLESLIGAAADLESKGASPEVMNVLGDELKKLGPALTGSKLGGHIAKWFGIKNSLILQGAATRAAKAVAKSGGPTLGGIVGSAKTPAAATKSAMQLRGYLLQALETATDEEE